MESQSLFSDVEVKNICIYVVTVKVDLMNKQNLSVVISNKIFGFTDMSEMIEVVCNDRYVQKLILIYDMSF